MDNLPYSVCFWGSHPDDGNDDCHTGADFATLAEAREYFLDPAGRAAALGHDGVTRSLPDTAYVELDGPDVHEVRPNPAYRPRRDDGDREWRRERAVQAGMGLGVQAYNDEMGY